MAATKNTNTVRRKAKPGTPPPNGGAQPATPTTHAPATPVNAAPVTPRVVRKAPTTRTSSPNVAPASPQAAPQSRAYSPQVAPPYVRGPRVVHKAGSNGGRATQSAPPASYSGPMPPHGGAAQNAGNQGASYGGANAQAMGGQSQTNGAPPPSFGVRLDGGQTDSALANNPARVLPDPQVDTSGAQTISPREMTAAEQASYYNQGGTQSQYQGITRNPGWYEYGTVATARTVVRRTDGKAVVIEAGQTIDRATLAAAPLAGDASAWGITPMVQGSPYLERYRQRTLEKVQQDQYVQQFGLPAGDTSTWRGWLSQYIAGGASSGAFGGAIGGTIVGTLAGGPLGGLAGFIGGTALGAILGDYGSQGMTYQGSEFVAAALGLQDAKKQFDQGLFGVLGILNTPAQWTEQGLGVGSQALKDPADTFANISAAWEAGKLYWDSDPTAGLRDNGKTFVDTDLPDATGGVAALAEARKRIAGGEDSEAVIAEMTARYGAFGMLRDLVGQTVTDPSNLMYGYLTNRAVAAGARAAGATAVLDDAGRVVSYAGRGATVLQAAEAAKPEGLRGILWGGGGLVDIKEAYTNLKMLEPFREGYQGLKSLNTFQRLLLGKDAVAMLEGTYQPPKGWDLFRKTPQAMAYDQITAAADVLQSHIVNNLPLDENFPAAANELVQRFRQAMGDAPEGADALTRAARSMQGEIVQRMLNHGGDVSGDLLTAYRNNRNEAALVETIAKRLGLSADDVVRQGADGIDELLGRFTRAGGELPQDLKPKQLAEVLKMFREGTVPRTPAEYRAALMGQLAAQAGQWSVSAFGVKSPSFLERIANLNKGVQSAVLLGLNPGYGINNVLNNEVTMWARGIFGFRSLKSLEAEMGRRGLGSPIRGGDTGLTADLIGEAQRANASIGDIMASQADSAVREASKPPADVLDRAQRGVSRVGQMMPVTAFAGNIEKVYSQRALQTAILDVYNRLWRRGVAFPTMGQELETALRAVDPRLPEIVHAAIENGANPAEITRAVFDPVQRVSSGAVLDDAAKRAGLAGDVARDLLDSTGLRSVIDDRLAALPENPSPADVRRVFNDIRVEAEGHIAELIAAQTKVEYEAAAQFGGADTGIMDGGAVLMLMDQNRGRQIDAYNAHARLRESIWDEYNKGVIDPDTFRQRLEDAGTQLYDRGLFPLQQANIDGIAEAFRRTGEPLPDEFTTLQRSVAMLTKDFHGEKQALYREFFSLPAERKTAAAWAEINRQIDEAYNNLTGHVAERQGLMDEYIAAAYEARFPGSGNPVREWRDLVRAHEAQYQEAVRQQFETTRQLTDAPARNAEWRRFDERMTRYRLQWAEAEKQARQAALEFVPGRDALEAEAKRIRGVRSEQLSQPVLQLPRKQITQVSRAELPEPLSRAMADEAKQMLGDLKNGEAGFRQFLGREYDVVVRALERIISGSGDVDKGNAEIVALLKEEILNRLATTDPNTGRPPEPEVLRWLGKTDAEIQAAADQWAASGASPTVPRILADASALTPEQSSTLVRNLYTLAAREDMAAGSKQAHAFRLTMVDPMGVAEVLDTLTGKTYEVPLDGLEAEAMLPPGMLAQDGGMPMPIGSAQSEMFEQARPLLQSMQESAVEHVQGGTLRGAGEADQALQDQLRAYLRTATDKQAEAKLLATRMGEARRDAALLNYNRRYMFDNLMGIVSPYQFWATHSMIAWAVDALQRPGLLASYYRAKRFLATAVTKQGQPSRLAGRVKIPIPWMPDWMGGGVWVDPLKLGLPLETFSAPWEEVAQRQSRLNDKIEQRLGEMAQAGQITQGDYTEALAYIRSADAKDDVTAGLQTATGLGEPKGYSEAKRLVLTDDPSLRYDMVDFAAQMFPPALLVNMAYQTLRGTPERQGPLPITRDLRNLTAALGINGGAGVNIEAGIRRQLNMPTFDEWGDYRVDRELANMAVEGIITAEQAQAAMIERKGSAFEMAQAREAQSGGADATVQIFGRLFGGAQVFPEGEATGRQLQLLYRAARAAQDNGDTEAIGKFLDRFPEVEARLALSKDPQNRMTQFLKDQIWAAYGNMPTLYRRQAQQMLGQDFIDAMTANSWDDIPADTLAAWARSLGRYVPDNVNGPALDLSWAPEGVAWQVQQFYDERNAAYNMQRVGELSDGYYALGKYDRVGMGPAPDTVAEFYNQRDNLYPGIGDLLGAYGSLPKNSEPAAREAAFPGIGAKLDQYYALPKGSGERKAYLNANPEIRSYFDWKDQYKAAHPEDGARAAFRAAHPELEQYFNWSDQYKAEHPEAAAYMESNAPRVRDVYMQQHPDLDQYWTWRRGWMDQHPESAAWIKETQPAQATEQQQNQDTPEARPSKAPIVGSPELQTIVEAYVFTGRNLKYPAKDTVLAAYEKYGKPDQTLYQYLAGVLAAGGVLDTSAEGAKP